ncbi:MAG: aldehyde dehydrogenase [Bacillaceae bacterium]|nr:aldehyde dehydrogenase [Bacillaceae bacterium]
MNISELVQAQKRMFHEGKTLTHMFRKHQLEKLKQALKRYEKDIYCALKQDLNKSEYEAFASEIGFLYAELDEAIKHLHSWMKPEKVKSPISHSGAKSYIYKQPYGAALIISPWNYPIQLTFAPLIGAIAAGNCSVIKPSELAPNVSRLIADMVQSTFEPDYIAVVEGDKEISQQLLEEPFDYIFFTGSVPVGKIVMEKASKHLTPVTLELGGKSPCIVDQDAKIPLAARRIAWGKFLNAGQTCIAPDYLLVHEDIKDELLHKLRDAIESFYGNHPEEHPEYTRIVNQRHFERLSEYLKDGQIVCGGVAKEEQLTISPTILDGVSWEDPIMQDEIFGPILPVLTFTQIEEVKKEIAHAPNPLALYLFTENEQTQEWAIENISFGGGCINDTLMHIANPNLPMGGIGTSGVGQYHGKASFDTFSHQKSIVKQTTRFDLSFRYPNSKIGLKILRKIFK